MSETPAETHERLSSLRRARRVTLAEPVGLLAAQAAQVYAALRPIAVEVDKIDHTQALEPSYSQLTHTNEDGSGRSVDLEFLFVPIQQGHVVSFMRSYISRTDESDWEFRRTAEPNSAKSLSTNIGLDKRYSVMDLLDQTPKSALIIDVARYSTYRATLTHQVTSQFDRSLCSVSNCYQDAEQYIQDFSADLARATELFG